MFTKLASFFINNWKLTLVLVILMMFTWIASYKILPKQYNPQITLPAFEISLKAPNLSNTEISKFIISPMENKIYELEWIDKVYGTAWDWYAWLMVQFNVWVDTEKAKIRLTQKLNENMWLKPLWVTTPIIKTIDADELPQITFAITTTSSSLSEEQTYIYLSQIANIVKEKLKTVENVTTLDIVWETKKDLIITLDNDKLKSRNLSSLEVLGKIKENNIFSKLWNISSENNENILIEIDWKIQNLQEIKKLIVSISWENIIYLEDIANIKYWSKRLNKTSIFNNPSTEGFSPLNHSKETVFLWIWKKIWTNAVTMTTKVIKTIEEIKKELPADIEMNVIQNEWETAKKATDMLINNLFQSIIIVFIVLSLSLWIKNALNTAISIPLTLFSVFTVALFLWETINRITLFALILVLWMLVDDSTVVVENINRHLENREKEWKTKLEAILKAIKEVELWVILSTITRLLAFWAMFAVWDMMWEYMWPIPKFALMASIISTFVALTINPWISFYTTKDIKKKPKQPLFKRKWSIRKMYIKFLSKFLWEEKREKKNRRIFKTIFRISLFIAIIWPIYIWIFKARMLPKSNQNQIYIWIDAPRWTSIEKTKEIWEYTTNLLKKESIIENISYTAGQAFMSDFWNLFRWWSTRVWENQLSFKINLTPLEEYENKYWESRISSEQYVISLRPLLRKHLLEKYPDLKISLLEDPPWPPVKATFLAKIKWDASEKNLDLFMQKTEKYIKEIWTDLDLVDIYNSKSSTYRKTTIEIDLIALNKAWISTTQIQNAILIANYWVKVNIINDKYSKVVTNIILTSDNDSLNSITEITLKNKGWHLISLDSLVTKKHSFVWNEINSDKREKTQYFYWEMWDNSLIYPVIKLFWILKSDDFLWDNYKIKDWNLYEINYIGLKDWKTYTIEWWWEWEITMDTFKDLWIAMGISLLLIYLLLVGQFSSFGIAWVIMMTFLLWFLWVFPWFSILYLLKNEYFSATSMIWVIALWWIVVWNAIILIEYINILKKNWILLKDALLKAWYTRFKPIILTSLTTILWATTIVWDPVWSGLARTIITWLLVSSILTLIVIPIFFYDSQKKQW